MNISKRTINGNVRWILDTGKSAGKNRERLTFRSKIEAEAHASKMRFESDRLKNGWVGLTEEEVTDDEKTDAMRALLIARQEGFLLSDAARAYVGTRTKASILKDAANLFFEAKERSGKRGAYMRHLRVIIGTFIKGRESQRMDTITPVIILEFLSPTRYKPATLQGMRRRLATWFAWCIRHKHCVKDPMEQVDEITVPHPAPKILTLEECERLLRAAEQTDRGLIPWLALGLFCGIRPEEIRRLTWENVKIDRGFVEISGEASKVRTRRLVQLLPAATEWLKLGGDLPPGNFWKRIRKLRAAADVTEWPCDVLRHTAASMMLCHYKDAQRTALELGNSPDILFRHYRELVTAEDAERFYKMAPSPDLLVAKNQEV